VIRIIALIELVGLLREEDERTVTQGANHVDDDLDAHQRAADGDRDGDPGVRDAAVAIDALPVEHRQLVTGDREREQETENQRAVEEFEQPAGRARQCLHEIVDRHM
jgi:hypothetical protein